MARLWPIGDEARGALVNLHNQVSVKAETKPGHEDQIQRDFMGALRSERLDSERCTTADMDIMFYELFFDKDQNTYPENADPFGDASLRQNDNNGRTQISRDGPNIAAISGLMTGPADASKRFV